MIKPKQVYYLEAPLSGRRETRSHYTAVVFVFEEKALLAPICSKRPYAYDATVELRPSDYARLKHDSFIEYSKAGLMFVQDLELKISQGYAKPCESLNEQVFLRIKKGFFRSQMTPRQIKKWIERL